jgi:beta-glucanase (GH16 family)
MKFTNKHKYTHEVGLALGCVLLLSMFTSCEKNDTLSPKRNYTLVWSDEFDSVANALPNVKKWTYDLGQNSGWGNNEYEYYTKSTTNVSTDGNGHLVITATNTNGTIYSARIKTKGLYAPTYGRIEARMKLPYGPGMWPAFWMLGSDDATNTWPACGEMDIMEMRGHQPSLVQATIHCPNKYTGDDTSITQAYGLTNGRFDTDYHLFAVEWTSDCIDFYVDDVLYREITKSEMENSNGTWVFNHAFYIILNLAVGGNYVTDPNVNTVYPQSMLVDYVRVYKEAN